MPASLAPTWSLLVLELKLLARRPGTIALAFALAALLAAAHFAGVKREAARAASAGALLAADARRMEGLQRELEGIESGALQARRFSDPRNAGRVGRNLGVREAVLPPAASGWLAVGVSDLRPWHYTVSTYHRSAFADDYELRSPLELQAGALDIAFVLGWVLPLVILVLGHDWLARDRETRRDRLLFVERGAFGRAAAARLGALLVLVCAVAAALAAAVLATGGMAQAGAALALAALTVTSGTFWIALVWAVNLWVARSAATAALLALAWLLTCVAGPALLDAGIRLVAPLPSRLEIMTLERRALLEADRRHSELLAQYMNDHPEAADPAQKVDVPEFLLRFTVQQREIELITAPARNALEAARGRQQSLLEAVQWLSPAVVVAEAVAALAGNDAHRHVAFERSVGGLHERWSAHFAPMVFAKRRFTSDMVAALPAMKLEDPGVRVAPAWVASACFALVAAMLAALAGGGRTAGVLRIRRTAQVQITGRST